MNNKSNKSLKWTEEKCFEAAKQCQTKTEMKRKFYCAFVQAKKHGWFVRYTWFRTSKIKWTREACYEAAKQCKSKTHFSKTIKGAYDSAKRNGWLSDYTWFIQNYTKNELRWTKEACYEAAKQCGNITEFRETYFGAYRRSKKYGWVNDYTWFNEGRRDIYKKVYTVYAYEDIENKCVYVGLTNNIKRRIMEHRKKDYKHKLRTFDRVREHFEKNNIEMPEPIVLIDGIDGIEAQEMEKYFLVEYSKNGWEVLNISKTGKDSSSLGNVGPKWTYEQCKSIAETCKTYREIVSEYGGAARAIRNNGWYELLPPKKHNGKTEITLEDCVEFCKNLESMDELKTINKEIHSKVKNNHWVTLCFPRKIYSKEECVERSKKYNSIAKAKKNDPVLVYSLKKFGLINLIHKSRKYTNYTLDEIKGICSRYENRTKLIRENRAMYEYCKKNGLLDEVIPSKRFKWTIDSAIEEARKYKGRDAFRTSHRNAYLLLREHGLLYTVFPKGTPTVKHEKVKEVKHYKKIKPTLSEDDCFKVASLCQYKREFREKFKKEYAFASRNKWLKNYTWLKGCKHVMTNDECISASKLCFTKGEFRERFPNEYRFAFENNILQSLTWLKRKKREPKGKKS